MSYTKESEITLLQFMGCLYLPDVTLAGVVSLVFTKKKKKKTRLYSFQLFFSEVVSQYNRNFDMVL